MKINAVLFDLDGVLADYSQRERVARMAEATGISTDAMWEAVYGSGLELEADSGGEEYTPDKYLAKISDYAGVTVTRDIWIAARRVETRLRPWMLDGCDQLQAAGIAIAMLTNNTLMFGESVRRIAPGLFPAFDQTAWTSAQFGTRKPFPEVYRRCLAHWGQDAATTLFIDDAESNVLGAREAGLIGCWYQSKETFVTQMRELGLPWDVAE